MNYQDQLIALASFVMPVIIIEYKMICNLSVSHFISASLWICCMLPLKSMIILLYKFFKTLTKIPKTVRKFYRFNFNLSIVAVLCLPPNVTQKTSPQFPPIKCACVAMV
jgi:hypothetical protein